MNRRSDGSLADAPDAALTARQREVIALVAEGVSNQAIADRLGLERLTVSEHIAAILWQLGLQARHEIAVWATAQRRPTESQNHPARFASTERIAPTLMGTTPPGRRP